MELAFLVHLTLWCLFKEISISLKQLILNGFDCSLAQIYMHTFKSSTSCPRRTVIHAVLICPSVCEGVCALISAACHFMSLSLPLLCSLYVALPCFALLCCACAWWFAFYSRPALVFVCFLLFLSFPDLHIHSSYLLHLPFLHWEWQAGIPLTNSVFCTQQTPVRTLRGQSSARHLPPCVCACVCV